MFKSTEITYFMPVNSTLTDQNDGR